MTAAAERRADLDLQINLFAEHELTRVLALVREVAKQLGVPEAGDPELEVLMQDIAPERLLQQIMQASEGHSRA